MNVVRMPARDRTRPGAATRRRLAAMVDERLAVLDVAAARRWQQVEDHAQRVPFDEARHELLVAAAEAADAHVAAGRVYAAVLRGSGATRDAALDWTQAASRAAAAVDAAARSRVPGRLLMRRLAQRATPHHPAT